MSANLRTKCLVNVFDRVNDVESDDNQQYLTKTVSSGGTVASKTRSFQGVARSFNRTLSDIDQQQNGTYWRKGGSAGKKRYLVPLNDSANKGVVRAHPSETRSLSANAKPTAAHGKLRQGRTRPSRVGFGDWSNRVSGDVLASPLPELSPEAILSDTGLGSFGLVREINLRARHLEAIPMLSKFVALRVLDLSSNGIRCISNLQNNRELRELKLYDNKIIEISDLTRLRDLQILHLQHNSITNIGKGLQGLTKLTELRLDCNRISLISPIELGICSQLTSLDLSSNQLTTIAAINSLPNLEELYVRSNKIVAISDLSSCRKLQEIDISNNPLNDMSGLYSLLSLTSINTCNCPLKTINMLKQLRNLEELYASHCQLVDLKRVVECFPQLQILDISNNCILSIDDLEVLSSLSELAEIYVSGNPVCSSVDDTSSLKILLRRLLPRLEILDGEKVSVGDSSTEKQAESVIQSSASDLVEQSDSKPLSGSEFASNEAISQLSAIEAQLSSFETEFASRFRDLRDSFNILPLEGPSSACSSARSSSRLSSRSGVKSRLLDAQVFATQHFET